MQIVVVILIRSSWDACELKQSFFLARYIYVADSGNNRIVKWTTNYTLGGTCVVGCTATFQSHDDSYGNLYVSDQGNHRVQTFMIQQPTSCISRKQMSFCESFHLIRSVFVLILRRIMDDQDNSETSLLIMQERMAFFVCLHYIS